MLGRSFFLIEQWKKNINNSPKNFIIFKQQEKILQRKIIDFGPIKMKFMEAVK